MKNDTLTYDAAGNRTGQTVTTLKSQPETLNTTYAWDAQDRLASVTMPHGNAFMLPLICANTCSTRERVLDFSRLLAFALRSRDGRGCLFDSLRSPFGQPAAVYLRCAPVR